MYENARGVREKNHFPDFHNLISPWCYYMVYYRGSIGRDKD